MGNKSSKSKISKSTKKAKNQKCNDDEKKEFKSPSNYDKMQWNEVCQLPFEVPTQPLINAAKLIFLSTKDNNTTCSIYDLNKSQFITESQEIKCDNENFDINNTVYTLNPNNNKIYFILKNTNIFTLDLNNFELVSLNKSITTKHKNKAQIIYNKNKDAVFIIGAEEKSDECKDEYVIIPYSTAAKHTAKATHEAIKKEGHLARVLNIERDGKDCIYILGGVKHLNEKDIQLSDSIWPLTLLDSFGKHDWKSKRKNEKTGKDEYIVTRFYTQHRQHSFGIINYKNKFLICFGGKEHRKKVKTVNYIWFLALTNENEDSGIEMNVWYEIWLKLPEKGYFHAIYPPNNKTDTLHLFNYNGKYYTVKMKLITDKIQNGQFNEMNKWTEAGKTVLATKSRSIKNMKPKNIFIEEMLEELGDEYEEYTDELDKKNFDTYQKIIDDSDNILQNIVENEEHRKVIIAKATELNAN